MDGPRDPTTSAEDEETQRPFRHTTAKPTYLYSGLSSLSLRVFDSSSASPRLSAPPSRLTGPRREELNFAPSLLSRIY
ncbi:unnamed protein product [Caenorhabditis auriculariae]|uniref:Uncharacterized protein n=1 Tax=Caenorhabditis auriculariae TaxID=2777116 RepID=A0A8S1GQS4_9PELO|nr:unnamed protein product [Caenorhabditis auriculariae]